MPSPSFSSSEQHIRSLFPVDSKFNFNGVEYKVLISAKPAPPKGECKTDVYVLASSASQGNKEFKISVKQTNADFLENKISLERAIEILGPNAQSIISQSIRPIRGSFMEDYLICFDKYRKTQAKSIKLGWKFELLNKQSGKSELLQLSEEQKMDVFSGNNLSIEKKNSYVNGRVIKGSGVANFILFVDPNRLPTTADHVMAMIQDINSYSKSESIYFACKALNFRASEEKWDGDRPLSVSVVWSIIDGKLHGELNFNNPLSVHGNEIGNNLQELLRRLHISAGNFGDLKEKIDSSVKYYESK